MKVYIVQNVARQVEGDLMVVQVEKGYASRAEAERHLASAPRQKTETIKTDAGNIECFCVRGIYEVEVEVECPTPPQTTTAQKPVTEIEVKFTPEEIARLQSLLRQQ